MGRLEGELLDTVLGGFSSDFIYPLLSGTCSLFQYRVKRLVGFKVYLLARAPLQGIWFVTQASRGAPSHVVA